MFLDDDDNDVDQSDSINAFLQSDMSKRKQDAEEIRETQLKTESRRKKAYKNYEQSCEIKGKFKVRSCPTIEQCLANQNKAATPAPKKKIGRGVFIDRRTAYELLAEARDVQDEDEDNDDDDDENAEESNEPAVKRLLFKSKVSELQEETNERRNKAFKKYEEYCEKRKFRIFSPRNCPAIDKAKCA